MENDSSIEVMTSESAPTSQDGQGTTQPTEDLVPIPEATDEELVKFLESADGKEPTPEEPAETEATVAKEESPPAQEEKPSSEKQEEEPRYTAKEFEALQEKLNRARKALGDAQTFITRRSEELGQLRAHLRSERDRRSKGLDEKFSESPSQAIEEKLAISKIDDALREVDNEERSLKEVGERQNLVHSHVDPNEFDIEAMSETLARDGLDNRYIEAFRNNPYASAHGETLIQLHHRAKAEKALRQLVPYAKKLQAENQQYKKGSVKLDKLQDAMKQRPSINGSAGVASATRKQASVLPSSMSDAEIAAFLQQSPRA